MGANDLYLLDDCFRGTGDAFGGIGLKNTEMMSEDDVSVFKHALNTWRKYPHRCYQTKKTYG